MKKYLDKLPEDIQRLIRLAADIAARNNAPAYLVGGFVRDLILGVKNLDLDFTIEGDGIKFAEDFSLRLGGKLIRHKRFGTATIAAKPYLKIDVATCRSESYPEPAHLPFVESGSLKDDLFRRDFTINAMAIAINKGEFGSLIDRFGGKSDLTAKKIRVMHSLSFIDDPTRILRAIRFEKRYNFRIEAETLGFLRDAVKRKMLEALEPQRTRDELILVLKEENPIKEIKRIQDLVGFKFINPHLVVSAKTYALLGAIGREIKWYKTTFPQHRHLDIWLLYFMGLIDSLSLQAAGAVCRRFALRAGEEKRLLSFKGIGSGLVNDLSKKRTEPARIFVGLEPLSYEAIILLKARYRNRQLQRNIKLFFKDYNGMRIHACGEDLRAMGLEPGPRYREIFREVLHERLNGRIRTREEELAFIRGRIRK